MMLLAEAEAAVHAQLSLAVGRERCHRESREKGYYFAILNALGAK